jgi:hypothetical protein
MAPGLRHVAWAAVAAFFIALALPAGALANGGGKCNASACKVYTEGPGSAGGHNAPPPGSGGPTAPRQLPVSSHTSRSLSHAGKDRKLLSQIVSNPSFGATRGLLKTGAATVAAPSALGAAFDIGSGPTLLLALLVATALALALHGGLRGWRRRRSDAPSA